VIDAFVVIRHHFLAHVNVPATMLAWTTIAMVACRGAQPPEPPPAPARLQIAAPDRGTWVATGSADADLGRLDCYSQEELDGCAARAQKPLTGPCGALGATATALLFVGMNCKNCFTDCYCKASVTTYTCR
jgi:hypothetical protein